MSSNKQGLPLVTAAVACYNQAQFVIETLESVKAQAYSNLHLVVVDDCSQDDSASLIRGWLDGNWPDAIFIAHKTNMGVCRTFNESLGYAQGKYFISIAADDRWVPNMLSRQIEIMERVPENVGVLYSDAFQIDEKGELLPKMFIENHRSFAKMPEGWIFDTLLEGNFIPGMTPVIRLRCFEVVGAADESLTNEDWDLWLRISRQFMFQYFPEPTAYYRVLPTSMTRAMSDEIVDSEQRMLVKLLRRGWIPRKKRARAVRAEFYVACQAYRRGLPSKVQEAAQVLRHRPRIKHLLLFLCVVVGLPYRYFERLISHLGNMNHWAKAIFTIRKTRREPR